MAYLIETLRRDGVRPVQGRYGKLDKDYFMVGPKDIRKQIEDVQTTAATSLSNHGLTRILTSGSTQTALYSLQAPVPGVTKKIWLQSTSTGCQLVAASGGAIFMGDSLTTVGSTVINFLKQGANVTLEAATTLLWLVTGGRSSLVSSDGLGYSYSTST